MIPPISRFSPSIIRPPWGICIVISTIYLIIHLLIISLLRIHSWIHMRHHLRHRWEPHCGHHKWIGWKWRKRYSWHPWHPWYERHIIERRLLLLLLGLGC